MVLLIIVTFSVSTESKVKIMKDCVPTIFFLYHAPYSVYIRIIEDQFTFFVHNGDFDLQKYRKPDPGTGKYGALQECWIKARCLSCATVFDWYVLRNVACSPPTAPISTCQQRQPSRGEERGAAPPKQQQQPENSEYSHQGIRAVLYGFFCDQKQVVVDVLT